MSETKISQAIVLNRLDYRESDSLLSVYTANFGKLSLLARGTKKINSKLSGHLEPFSLIDILIIKGRGFDYIGSAFSRRAFLNIKNDLNKLYYAGAGIRSFNRLVKEGEKDENLFFLLKGFLELLDDYREDLSKERGEIFYSFFILKLLLELGYGPEMYECLDCHTKIKTGKNYFNLKNGGLICSDCFNRQPFVYQKDGLLAPEILQISDNSIKLIRLITSNELGVVKKLYLEKKYIHELAVLIDSFLDFRL